MISVAGRTVTVQCEIRILSPFSCCGARFDDKHPGALTEVQALAVTVKGGAKTGIGDAERGEAAVRHMVQLIGPAGDRDVAQTALEPGQRHAYRIGPRGARINDAE